MMDKTEIYIIKNTLEQIEVRGKGNLEKLLGVINYLEKKGKEEEASAE